MYDKIMNQMSTIQIEDLYYDLLEAGAKVVYKDDYELIECKDIQIQTVGNKYVDLKWLSRHKTAKDLVELTYECNMPLGPMLDEQIGVIRQVVVTTDHVCMRVTRDHFFENVDAKSLVVGDNVSVYDATNDKEYLGKIIRIGNLGKTIDYVYDCEVDDDQHSFYANELLIHNSQFVNLKCVSEHLMKKNNQTKVLHEWPKYQKQELWDTISKFVDDEVNKFVRELAHQYCHTNEQNVLTYELEYMTSVGIFEGKKHYYINKMFDEGDLVDKIKITGLELKKGVLPKEMKNVLQEAYDGVLFSKWGQKEYDDFITKLYEKFKTYTIDQIAFWKGYSAERQAAGFLTMEVGSTGVAKSATYYNQIIEKLGLGKKYDSIIVGNKVRQCYIEKSNPYGIDTIAYPPGQWPKEFDDLFKVDYPKMFDKIVVSPLKRYREACGFTSIDPRQQVVQDIFDL